MAQTQKPRALVVILTRKEKQNRENEGEEEKKLIIVEVQGIYCATFAGSGCKKIEYNFNCIEIPMQINKMIPCRKP